MIGMSVSKGFEVAQPIDYSITTTGIGVRRPVAPSLLTRATITVNTVLLRSFRLVRTPRQLKTYRNILECHLGFTLFSGK